MGVFEYAVGEEVVLVGGQVDDAEFVGGGQGLVAAVQADFWVWLG